MIGTKGNDTNTTELWGEKKLYKNNFIRKNKNSIDDFLVTRNQLKQLIIIKISLHDSLNL